MLLVKLKSLDDLTAGMDAICCLCGEVVRAAERQEHSISDPKAGTSMWWTHPPGHPECKKPMVKVVDRRLNK